jgi:hypothetical protein
MVPSNKQKWQVKFQLISTVKMGLSSETGCCDDTQAGSTAAKIRISRKKHIK